MNLERATKQLGKTVKKLRTSRGITQEQMASHGFNYRYFQKIEAGQVNVTLGTLVKLAKTFKCKLSELFDE